MIQVLLHLKQRHIEKSGGAECVPPPYRLEGWALDSDAFAIPTFLLSV